MSKKKRKALDVEDHGNGFMVLGTLKPRKALKVLRDYVDDVEPFRFFAVTFYEGRGSVWCTTGPGEHWDGARDSSGKPLKR